MRVVERRRERLALGHPVSDAFVQDKSHGGIDDVVDALRLTLPANPNDFSLRDQLIKALTAVPKKPKDGDIHARSTADVAADLAAAAKQAVKSQK